jgi:hypothetical protein
MDNEDLDRRFDFHPAVDQDTRKAHKEVRGGCRRLAGYINENVPDGREKSLAITSLEETMMWANAGIARGEA